MLTGLYQIGYVTRDLDRAMAAYTLLSGVRFTAMDIELAAQTPHGDKTIGVRVATGWAGLTQIELIQPVRGYIDPYLNVLPADDGDASPRLHHLAVRREDINQARADVAASGLPLVFETGGNGITSLFVDARARLGHHLEVVCATPEGWAMLGWPHDV